MLRQAVEEQASSVVTRPPLSQGAHHRLEELCIGNNPGLPQASLSI